MLVDKAAAQGAINGFSVSEKGRMISHLQFADDTLFFLDNKETEIRMLKDILQIIAWSSGLKVNFAKSAVFQVGGGPDCTLGTGILNCRMEKLPTVYLGLPLGAVSNKATFWKPVILKIQSRIQNWKNKYLSKAARVILIKSILSSMPVYYLSLFLIPKGAANQIEKIIRKFFWNETDTRKKIHTVHWDNICISKESGGLGIKQIRPFNASLLLKWQWRYATAKDDLWRQIIKEKFNKTSDDWDTGQHQGKMGSNIWPRIRKDGNQFWNLVQFKVGNGEKVLFWKHLWLGADTLDTQFPKLYNLSQKKLGSVAEFRCRSSDRDSWDLSLRRPPRDVEMQEVVDIISLLDTVVLSEESDKLIWLPDSTKQFTVKSCYNTLTENQVRQQRSARMGIPQDYVWDGKIPARINMFLWEIDRKAVLTKHKINKIFPENDKVCVLCSKQEETLAHILLECEFTKKLWKEVLNGYSIQAPIAVDVKSWITWWLKQKWHENTIHWFWHKMPAAIWWSTWLHRNDILFNQKTVDWNDTWQCILTRIKFWGKHLKLKTIQADELQIDWRKAIGLGRLGGDGL